MPSAKHLDHEIPQVDAFAALLKDALVHAQSVKSATTIEPPLTKVDFENVLAQLPTIFPCASPDYVSENLASEKARQYAVVETAARNVFSSLVVSSKLLSISAVCLLLLTLSRLGHQLIPPSSSKSGISSTSCRFCLIASNATLPFFSGSWKSYSTVKRPRDVGRYSTSLSLEESKSSHNI